RHRARGSRPWLRRSLPRRGARDQRWDRVHRAWEAIVEAKADYRALDAEAGLQAAHLRGATDECVAPTVIAPPAGEPRPMADGDAVVFMNFRADRARQLTAAFVSPGFSGFEARRPALARFTTLTEYDAKLPVHVAFPPEDLHDSFGAVLADRGLTQ